MTAASFDPTLLDPILVRLNRKSGKPLRRIGITSAVEDEGVTTLAAELASACARHGKAVALVEANWRRPRLAEDNALAGRPGLADIVAGDVAPSAGAHPIADGVALVPAGTAAAIAKASLDDGRVDAFLGLVDQRYDLTIVDCPPISRIGETAMLSSALCGFIVVVGAERTRRAVAEQALRDLDEAGGAVIGAVLNRWRRPIPKWLYRRLG